VLENSILAPLYRRVKSTDPGVEQTPEAAEVAG